MSSGPPETREEFYLRVIALLLDQHGAREAALSLAEIERQEPVYTGVDYSRGACGVYMMKLRARPAIASPSPPLPMPTTITTHGAPSDVDGAAMQAALEEAGLPLPSTEPPSPVPVMVEWGSVIGSEIGRMAGVAMAPIVAGQMLTADMIRTAIVGDDIARFQGAIIERLPPRCVSPMMFIYERDEEPQEQIKHCCRGDCAQPREEGHAFCQEHRL